MKIIIMIFFVAIIYSLGSALYYMMNKATSENMVKALALRIGLSMALFLLMMIAYYLGWISPNTSTRF